MSRLNSQAMRRVRHQRVRKKVKGTPDRVRLCVFRSLNHIYAQVIDDIAGHTLAAASTLDPELKGQLTAQRKLQQAELVGGLLARRALDRGISRVVLDRGGCLYHGRVKALAEAARRGGLAF